MSVKIESADKSEIVGILLRIFAGALIVGLLIVWPALEILSAAWT